MIYTDLYKQFNEQFWNFFLNSELARNSKAITWNMWLSRNPATRKAMFNHLSEHGAPKENPMFWAKRFPESVPTNYFGKELARGVTYYTAIYNGKKGLYTAADVEFYEMQDPQPFKI